MSGPTLADDCLCGLDGEQRACVEGRVYGPCDHPNCGGVCEMEADCDCPCHHASRTAPTVADADHLAFRAHHGQVDKAGRPYIDHPRAVAAILAQQGHSDHAVMAGLLHDVVEDTPITLDDLRAAGFPEDVVSAVDAVTRRDGETYMDMIRRAAADPLGRLVKLADNANNSDPQRMALLDPADAERRGRRYAKARAVLLAGSAADELDAFWGPFNPAAERG
ncbi:HD domain-containing protein [Micromonospora chalcea]|uniref:HD domain-containing protein n=1 Tax=Micromonospora chalcea TaxID=1874 RepID=UPI00380FF1C4